MDVELEKILSGKTTVKVTYPEERFALAFQELSNMTPDEIAQKFATDNPEVFISGFKNRGIAAMVNTQSVAGFVPFFLFISRVAHWTNKEEARQTLNLVHRLLIGGHPPLGDDFESRVKTLGFHYAALVRLSEDGICELLRAYEKNKA